VYGRIRMCAKGKGVGEVLIMVWRWRVVRGRVRRSVINPRARGVCLAPVAQ
jgi:hypothetical protein